MEEKSVLIHLKNQTDSMLFIPKATNCNHSGRSSDSFWFKRLPVFP